MEGVCLTSVPVACSRNKLILLTENRFFWKNVSVMGSQHVLYHRNVGVVADQHVVRTAGSRRYVEAIAAGRLQNST